MSASRRQRRRHRAGTAHARGGQAAHRADRPRVSRRRGVSQKPQRDGGSPRGPATGRLPGQPGRGCRDLRSRPRPRRSEPARRNPRSCDLSQGCTRGSRGAASWSTRTRSRRRTAYRSPRPESRARHAASGPLPPTGISRHRSAADPTPAGTCRRTTHTPALFLPTEGKILIAVRGGTCRPPAPSHPLVAGSDTQIWPALLPFEDRRLPLIRAGPRSGQRRAPPSSWNQQAAATGTGPA
jgi:hypothetical protein